MFIQHDELAFTVEHEYPGLKHGVDFLVGHPLDEDGKQEAEAYLVTWKAKGVDQPDVAVLKQKFEALRSDYQAYVARAYRDAYIAKTDWTQHTDVPQETRDKWVEYRQALRDITKQPGFPADINWPVQPA